MQKGEFQTTAASSGDDKEYKAQPGRRLRGIVTEEQKSPCKYSHGIVNGHLE